MKCTPVFIRLFALLTILVVSFSCNDIVNEPPRNVNFSENTDYTQSADMVLPLIGAYSGFYSRGWETIPLIAVRGDDINPGGLGDQQDFAATDTYQYNKDYWMYNSLWEVNYSDILRGLSAIEEIKLYQEAGADNALANQYIAEVKVLNAYLLFNLSRVFGSVLIPPSADPSDLLATEASSKDEVMQYISDEMAAAAAALPTTHPADRTDLRGGVNRYTALTVQALANLELENYQGVADATGDIINSGVYQLESDFYELFKTQGKLNRENILELQYSDYGTGAGESSFHLYAFYGPQNWTPAVEGANSGWGFFEPSMKFIKFMLDRGEQVRLETSVLFTNRGIAQIQEDPAYADLPDFVSNTTRDGDVINDYARALFASGKMYLPSNELTPGRNGYGNNKNYTCLRYAEVLLMHAEALTRGANSSAMTADAAVNLVRQRAGLSDLSGVTADQVMEEKFAELATEWGSRYYDMVRLRNFSELSYDGRNFTEDKIFLPYPQEQVDMLPGISN